MSSMNKRQGSSISWAEPLDVPYRGSRPSASRTSSTSSVTSSILLPDINRRSKDILGLVAESKVGRFVGRTSFGMARRWKVAVEAKFAKKNKYSIPEVTVTRIYAPGGIKWIGSPVPINLIGQGRNSETDIHDNIPTLLMHVVVPDESPLDCEPKPSEAEIMRAMIHQTHSDREDLELRDYVRLAVSERHLYPPTPDPYAEAISRSPSTPVSAPFRSSSALIVPSPSPPSTHMPTLISNTLSSIATTEERPEPGPSQIRCNPYSEPPTLIEWPTVSLIRSASSSFSMQSSCFLSDDEDDHEAVLLETPQSSEIITPKKKAVEAEARMPRSDSEPIPTRSQTTALTPPAVRHQIFRRISTYPVTFCTVLFVILGILFFLLKLAFITGCVLRGGYWISMGGWFFASFEVSRIVRRNRNSLVGFARSVRMTFAPLFYGVCLVCIPVLLLYMGVWLAAARLPLRAPVRL